MKTSTAIIYVLSTRCFCVLFGSWYGWTCPFIYRISVHVATTTNWEEKCDGTAQMSLILSLLLITIHYFQTNANTLLYTNIVATYTFTMKRSYRYLYGCKILNFSIFIRDSLTTFGCDISKWVRVLTLSSATSRWVRHPRCRTQMGATSQMSHP